MSAEEIFKSLAEKLQNEEDLKFARLLVEDLNTIMFTAKELQTLRDSIKSLETQVILKYGQTVEIDTMDRMDKND